MGQRSGRSLASRESFLQEQSRVLRLSAEVLARTDDNIDAENSFLLDYNAQSISAKVELWIRSERANVETSLVKFGNELKHKMSKDYERAYEDLRRFGETVDKLATSQRRIHKKLLDLEPSNRKKLVRLRLKVFENLRVSEKMLFRDRRLRGQFVRKVYDIDHESLQLCREKMIGG